MRFEAAIVGDLRAAMKTEMAAAERAVTYGVRDAAEGLKAELRNQVLGAGLGPRVANAWRGEVYPKGQQSIAAAGWVWSKAPRIIAAFNYGATIRSRGGQFLAIPTKEAGAGARGKRLTPGLWERMHGLRLRFIYRRNGPSMLVADNVRINRRGVATRNIGRSGGREFTRLSNRATIPIFWLVPQVTLRKRLNVEAAAGHWERALPVLIERSWPRDQA